jgi:hypothetical protein
VKTEGDWLGDLEDRVREAAAELTRLREENEELKSQVVRHTETDAAAAWAVERDELRRRVEALVAQLESLLAGD